MKQLIVTMLLTVGGLAVQAMPTKAELTEAQPLVGELMAEDVAAFKAKTKTAEQVGDVSVKYVESAETEAVKFLLLKGAVSYYVRAEAYDKAADAVANLQRTVKDVPPAAIAEIVGKATGKISETKAPRLYAQYRAAKLQVNAEGEAKALAAKLKKVKSDALQRKYAEALAISGDWKAAYAEFAKVSDAKLKAIVEAESKDAVKNMEAGEFWWAYKPTMEDADDFFKSHAAAFYQKALAADEVSGIKKNLVEKRLKQLPCAGVANKCIEKSDIKPVANFEKTSPRLEKQGKTMKLKIKNGVEIEFVQCPAGSFMMGKDGDNDPKSVTRRHKVTFTRPFWISKTQVTRAQWDAFERPRATVFYKKGADVSDIPVSFVTYDMANEFTRHLTRRFASQLPRDCIVRLPTEAEWEYALTAGAEDFSDPYILFRDGSRSEKDEAASRIAVTRADIERDIVPMASEEYKKKIEAKEDATAWLRYRVGKKLPNAWGLYDMLGNGPEIMLDTVKQPVDWEKIIMPIGVRDRIRYSEEETDPLRLDEVPGKFGSACVVRGAIRFGGTKTFYPDWHARDGVPTSVESNGQTFRLVVGPDLVSEWKAKHGKK